MIRSGTAALIVGSLALLFWIHPLQAADLQTAQLDNSLVSRYQQAISADPGNLTLHYLLGVTLLETGDYASALRELQVAYPAYRNSIEAHYNLGVAAAKLSDYDSAMIYLEQAEALGAGASPGIYPLANLYFNAALHYRDTAQVENALLSFDKVLELDPERLEVYPLIGDLYAQQDNTEAALSAFRAYLSAYPDDPVSTDYVFTLEYNRALDRLAVNDFEGAEAGFKRAQAYDPGNSVIGYYLGYIKYQQGQLVDAAMQLQKVYPEVTGNVRDAVRSVLYNCSLTLRKTGQVNLAKAVAETLADADDAHFNELYLAGTIALDQRDDTAAHAYLARAVALQPDHAGALQNLVRAEQGAFDAWLDRARDAIERQDFEAGNEALSEAAAIQPGNALLAGLQDRLERSIQTAVAGYFSAGRRALATGDYPAAETSVNAGLQLAPKDPTGLALRNEIVAALAVNLTNRLREADRLRDAGQWERAIDLYRQVLAIEPDNSQAQAGLSNTRQGRQAEIDRWLADARVAYDNRELDQAERLYQSVLTADPEHPLAQEQLATIAQLRDNRLAEYVRNGRLAIERGQFADARRWIDRAEQLAVTDQVKSERARLDQAVAKKTATLVADAIRAQKAGHYPQAEKLYNEAIRINPEDRAATDGLTRLTQIKTEEIADDLNRARNALRENQFATAIAAYRQVLDLQPDNREAVDGLQTSRSKAAEELQTRLDQAEFALRRGDLMAAEQQLAKALELDAYHREAQAIRQRIEQLKSANVRPEDAGNLYLQGVAHYTQGRYTEAIQAWENVLALDPGHLKAKQNIEKTRHKLKQLEEYRGG